MPETKTPKEVSFDPDAIQDWLDRVNGWAHMPAVQRMMHAAPTNDDEEAICGAGWLLREITQLMAVGGDWEETRNA